MWSSRYAATFSSCLRESVARSRSTPCALTASGSETPSRSASCLSSSWSRIEPAAALEPNSERPNRAPSSSAQLTRRAVTGGSPSSAIRRKTSEPATTLSAPSSQPPFGTESRWPPISSSRSERPRRVHHWLRASSNATSAPVASSFDAIHSCARTHVSVQATRWAPSSLPVSSRSSFSSATVRLGSNGMGAIVKRGKHLRMAVAVLRRVGMLTLVLAALCALWEAFKWFGETTGLKLGAFVVNDRTFPHIHDIVGQLFEPSRRNGPMLIEVLWDAALFTAKEAAVGFALGASIGFLLGTILAHSRLLQRGFLPYIVASQTIPILAIAPMVVVWLGGRGAPDWFSVSVISAYLTFFPVAINTLRGLTSADPRALELMRSYAAGPLQILWKVRIPSSLPFLFAAFKISATASVVGAIIGELPASIQDGLGGAILNFNQYYATSPPSLWATNLIAALLGIAFFLIVVVAERIVVRRAPEHVA